MLHFCLKDLLPLRCFVLAVLKVSSQELSNSSYLVLSVSSALKYWEQSSFLWLSLVPTVKSLPSHKCLLCMWEIRTCWPSRSCHILSFPCPIKALLPFSFSTKRYFYPFLSTSYWLSEVFPAQSYLQAYLIADCLLLICPLHRRGLPRCIIYYPLFPIATCLVMMMTGRWRVKTAEKEVKLFSQMAKGIISMMYVKFLYERCKMFIFFCPKSF